MGDLKPDADTNEILRAIWTEIKELGSSLGGRIDQTNARLDLTNARLDETNVRLSGVEARVGSLEQTTDELRRAMVEAEMRVATELVTLSGVVKEMKDAFLESRQLEHLVRDHEKRIAALERSH